MARLQVTLGFMSTAVSQVVKTHAAEDIDSVWTVGWDGAARRLCNTTEAESAAAAGRPSMARYNVLVGGALLLSNAAVKSFEIGERQCP